ncbi:unnamed protein product [Protopolystoma xenopodis]|uniref:Uncharacterized protein n=1 Tax=Protopolystoma xenopodis TaxID=117903 RepID=A0A3S5FBP4_9PLAT|nr:unnamed protein product [Protopolystoma xenopodis]
MTPKGYLGTRHIRFTRASLRERQSSGQTLSTPPSPPASLGDRHRGTGLGENMSQRLHQVGSSLCPHQQNTNDPFEDSSSAWCYLIFIPRRSSDCFVVVTETRPVRPLSPYPLESAAMSGGLFIYLSRFTTFRPPPLARPKRPHHDSGLYSLQISPSSNANASSSFRPPILTPLGRSSFQPVPSAYQMRHCPYSAVSTDPAPHPIGRKRECLPQYVHVYKMMDRQLLEHTPQGSGGLWIKNLWINGPNILVCWTRSLMEMLNHGLWNVQIKVSLFDDFGSVAPGSVVAHIRELMDHGPKELFMAAGSQALWMRWLLDQLTRGSGDLGKRISWITTSCISRPMDQELMDRMLVDQRLWAHEPHGSERCLIRGDCRIVDPVIANALLAAGKIVSPRYSISQIASNRRLMELVCCRGSGLTHARREAFSVAIPHGATQWKIQTQGMPKAEARRPYFASYIHLFLDQSIELTSHTFKEEAPADEDEAVSMVGSHVLAWTRGQASELGLSKRNEIILKPY